MEGAGARTWISPKCVKRLPVPGRVFGTCVDPSGGYVISVLSQKGERWIQSLDQHGVVGKSFIPRATKGGRSFEVYQLQVTPDDKIIAASRNCVTAWSKDGKLLMEHGRNMFKFAKWIALRSTGEIVVSDTDDDSVKVISPGGQQIVKLQCAFKCPVGIAADSDDNVIVADWNDTIRIFDAENRLTHTFGTKGDRDAQFDFPYGLSVDCDDNIMVADMWNNRISLYSRDGAFIRHVVHELGPRRIRRPAYLSVSTSTTVFRMIVSDFTGSLLSIYEY